MRLGFRTRLFLLAASLLALMGLVTALALQFAVAREFDRRVEADLEARVRLVRLHVAVAPKDQLDAVADATRAAADARVTIVGLDGRVLGDSEVSAEGLAVLDDHSRRPEVVMALQDGVGHALRFSDTVQQMFWYTAMPYEVDGSVVGVVRVAKPLSELEGDRAQLQALVVGTTLLGLVVAGLFTFLASHLLANRLRDLLEHARLVGARVHDADSLGGITSAFDQMAAEVDRALADLADERNRFRAVLETLAEGVVALDEAGRIVVLNRAARRLFGIGATGDLAYLVDATQLPALETLARDALAGARGGMEVELRPDVAFDGPGARPRRLLVTAQPQHGGGCVLVLREVTELRRLEAIRRDFVANVSHELRTPVAAVRASAEALEAGAVDEPELRDRFLDAIRRNSERLGALIVDLLSLSRIEAGSYAFEAARVDVGAACDAVLDALDDRITDAEHTVTCTFDERFVLADPGALEQVLTNLIANAVTYTPSRGCLVVSSQRVGDAVRVSVADNGPGVPAEHRPRLFERFYRVDPGRSRSEGGTGLGLAIVKHLVESMGGRVGMTPNLPGSVFWFELPFAPDEPTVE